MNIRKNIDYSEMYEALDMLMTKQLPQMELYCEIGKPDEKRLDLYEGYHEHGHSFYDKEQIAVKMDDGSTITGMVYIMDPRMDFGNPSAGYYDIVHRGYEDCGLDTAVLNRAVSDSMDLAQHRMEREGLRFC